MRGNRAVVFENLYVMFSDWEVQRVRVLENAASSSIFSKFQKCSVCEYICDHAELLAIIVDADDAGCWCG